MPATSTNQNRAVAAVAILSLLVSVVVVFAGGTGRSEASPAGPIIDAAPAAESALPPTPETATTGQAQSESAPPVVDPTHDPRWRHVFRTELALAVPASADRQAEAARSLADGSGLELDIDNSRQRPTPKDKERSAQIATTMAGPGWEALRTCESNNTYSINTGNGFYGAYQFTLGTWDAVANTVDPYWAGVRPDLAPAPVQDRMAHALRYEVDWGGWQHWPVCGVHIQ